MQAEPKPRDEDRDLVALDTHDEFEVASGSPDPRQWAISAGSADEIVGHVADLIADQHTMRVRYLDVALEDTSHVVQRHLLVPVSGVRFAVGAKRVSLGLLDRNDLERLPAYTDFEVSRDYEEAFERAVRQKQADSTDEGKAGVEGRAWEASAGIPLVRRRAPHWAWIMAVILSLIGFLWFQEGRRVQREFEGIVAPAAAAGPTSAPLER
jgi:hypothetical protein